MSLYNIRQGKSARGMVAKTKDRDRVNEGVIASVHVSYEWFLPQKLPIEHRGWTKIIER